MEEDITIEFYYKKATYISPITKCSTFINIKRVFIQHWKLGGLTVIQSTNNVFYDKEQLTDFTI